MANWIELTDHPSSQDPTAKLEWCINHGRMDAVYSVRGGFVATASIRDGNNAEDWHKALPETFPTLQAARDALAAA